MKFHTSHIMVRLTLAILGFSFFFHACKQTDENLEYEVQSWYKHREDGKPGREVLLKFPDDRLSGRIEVEVRCEGRKENEVLELSDSVHEFAVLLHEGAGVEEDCYARIRVKNKDRAWSGKVFIPEKRQWKILIYPHSHVDIGYTNTHANIELIHKRNLVNGLDLARKTSEYPEGAKYLWNPEVIWPVDRYLSEAGEEEKEALLQGIKDGCLHLDAGYVNLNTSIAGDEEMLDFFRPANSLARSPVA